MHTLANMRLALVLAAVAALGGCKDGSDPGPIEMERGIEGRQQDRNGRPAITTVLLHQVDQMAADVNRDVWNLGAPDTDATNSASAAAKAKIDGLLSLGTPQTVNGVVLTAAVLKAVLVDGGDALRVNTAGTTNDFLGVEVGVPGSFGGRALATDVVDVELAVLTGGAITTDNVDANDRPFLAEFPYLPPPQ